MAVQPKRIVTPQISTSSRSGLSVRILVAIILIASWTWGVYLVGRDGFGSGEGNSSGQGKPQTEYEALKMQGAGTVPKLQLQIKDIAIIPGDKEGSFKYKTTVEPLMGMEGVATGTLKLVISGENDDGDEQVIEIPDTKDDVENGYRPFSLSQDLTGDVTLPNGFEPENIALKLFTGEDTSNPLIQKYSWSDVLAEKKQEETKVSEDEKMLADLERENLALKIKLAKAEAAQYAGVASSGQGDGLIQMLKQERDAMAKEVEELRQKISDIKGKVEIKEISLKTKVLSREVEFYASVSRTVQDGPRLTGTMQISLIGTEAEQRKIYTQDEITTDKQQDFRLGFRNFQEIKESLVLPKGFSPEKMAIHIVPEDKEIPEVRKEYDWEKLTGG